MAKATNSQGKKKRASYNTNTIVTDFGGLLCFSSIFFFIIGLAGGSVPITAIGVAVFLVGYFCLRRQS